MLTEFEFTKAKLDALTAPGTYRDTKVPGLQLRIRESGSKTYYTRRRLPAGGDGPRIPIARYNKVSLAAARQIAADRNNQIAAGINVAQLRQDAKAEPKLLELFESYFIDRTARGKRSVEAMRQLAELWLLALPNTGPKKHGRKRVKPPGSVDWSARRLSEITRPKVAALHSRILATGKRPTSNRVLELISAAFEYGKRAGLHILDNPADGVEAAPERERSRFLQADELPRFIAALEATPQPWRDYFEVLLFVGFRRTATAAMRWQDVDLLAGTWTVPQKQSKSGDELVLPLTGRALSVLKRRYKERGDSQWVFPGGNTDGHIGRPKLAWAKLLTAAQLPDLHLHDLRRSLGSWLAMSGRSLPEIGRVLGHKDQRSTQIYARLKVEAATTASATAQKAMLAAARKVRK